MEKEKNSKFNIDETIHRLKHYLPAQAPLKDFIHHNTLHAFQNLKFQEGLEKASETFGYKVYLSLKEYRAIYEKGLVNKEVFNHVISRKTDKYSMEEWTNRLLFQNFNEKIVPRIGKLKEHWKEIYHIDIESMVHPLLFRIICSFLDQGVAVWGFPTTNFGFIKSLAKLEKNSLTSFFRTERARNLLLHGTTDLKYLLKILVGDETLFEQYLFDIQFSHPGWSGIVSVIEEKPETLLDSRKITLLDFICFELLLEIDTLDYYFGEIWSPLGYQLKNKPLSLFADSKYNDLFEVYYTWQLIIEETYYQEVINAILKEDRIEEIEQKSFQALFCIDDRECSLRRHIEEIDSTIETFGTAGHFNLEFYYQPTLSKFYSKVCPVILTPKVLIKEINPDKKIEKDFHFSNIANGLILGWFYTHFLAVWSILKLLLGVFKPSDNSSTVSSFRHMEVHSTLTIENNLNDSKIDGLQVGFTVNEMADRLEGLLKSIGLIKNFAPIIYSIGHGSSNVNNTHYAGYDCGACSGRPGSVNARVISFIGNHSEVRKILKERGINIPDSTIFIGGLHDTAKDMMVFFDCDNISETHRLQHLENIKKMDAALEKNAVERSRRFDTLNSNQNDKVVHEQVKLRTISLFEPRPEYNHATNSLCIVGRRNLSKNIFFDRRAFLNSYDYKTDLEGKYLLGILNAVAPVCGGINLEYYFSRVDNENLGAGTKLPHNAMGLIGVSNGTDGDLRPGLPIQMVEIHDPIRLLVVVEHFPEIVLNTIKKNNGTLEWFENEWINLIVVNPETNEAFMYMNNKFEKMKVFSVEIGCLKNLSKEIKEYKENIPISSVS
ncbi:MAG: DUF2309 domain-containing protein [Flavobacteriia bacterium]|nr:DUF2309 domain-containing protein [Flavobacteriia bacterium]